MNVPTYLSGLALKHTQPFVPEINIQNLGEQTLGFKLMESSFHTPPTRPKYLTQVKVYPNPEAKKGVAF